MITDEKPSRETALILRIMTACNEEPDARRVIFALCACLMAMLVNQPKSVTDAAIKLITNGKPPPFH
jgi:hypothetical protein